MVTRFHPAGDERGLAYLPIISTVNDYEAAAIDTGCLTNVLNKYHKVFGDLNDYEAAAINTGCLTEVLSKHQKVFGESGKLPVADLPQVTITTEPWALVVLRPNRMDHHLFAAWATTASRYYNQERLTQKATTGQIKVVLTQMTWQVYWSMAGISPHLEYGICSYLSESRWCC